MTASEPTPDARVVIEEVHDLSDELVAAVGRLIPQLSSSARAPTASELEELVTSEASRLFVARLMPAGRIVGMLTLAVFRLPTGVNAVIEDVVVDDDARGDGVGTSLVRAALDEAARHGARHVDLTSRPSREAANRLYGRVGFSRRETNVYRFTPQ